MTIIKMSKPYRGKIYHWKKTTFDKTIVEDYYGESAGLGYVIEGFQTKEPRLGSRWRTSWVVKHTKTGWIETRNSRYKLVGPESTPTLP